MMFVNYTIVLLKLDEPNVGSLERVRNVVDYGPKGKHPSLLKEIKTSKI